MKLRIPKDMRGVGMPRIFTVEMNDFDIDFYLPALFYKVLADGRARARRTNDPTAVARYVDALATHPSLVGFDGPDGRRVLDRLVRTSLVTMGRTGVASGGREQILSLEPYTALAHKAGFPASISRLRRTDVFIYRVLRESLGSADLLHSFIADVFGHGVTFGTFPGLGGAYDGHTELDTLTRLSLAFLDGFDDTPVSKKRDIVLPPACPAHAASRGEDLLRYLFAYHARMPAQALSYYFLGLLNLELFSYTLSLVHAVNTLVRDPSTLPPAMRTPYASAPPQLYLDFTDRSGSLSREMSTACVRRDIEAYQQIPWVSYPSASARRLHRTSAADSWRRGGNARPDWRPMARSTFRGCSLPIKTLDWGQRWRQRRSSTRTVSVQRIDPPTRMTTRRMTVAYKTTWDGSTPWPARERPMSSVWSRSWSRVSKSKSATTWGGTVGSAA